MTTDNRPACRRCLIDLPDCPHCLRVILPGQGFISAEKDCYCYRCADKRPCCRRCYEPFFEAEPSQYCAGCSQKIFCHQCDLECAAAYYVDTKGPRCKQCCTCQGCGEKGPDVVDFKCPGCAGGPVMTLEEGLALYPAAYEFLREVMELTIQRIPRLLVSVEMPDVKVRQYPDGLKEGRITIGLHGGGRIWVRGGYPEHTHLFILVHELAHAWQAENCPHQSDGLTEGFAQWLEYKCAVHLNYPEYASRIRHDACPVYGGGLRKALIWEEAVGWRQLLDDIRLSRDFPDWILRGWCRSLAA